MQIQTFEIKHEERAGLPLGHRRASFRVCDADGPWPEAGLLVDFKVEHVEPQGFMTVEGIHEGPGGSEVTFEFRRAAVRALARSYELHTEQQVVFSDEVLQKNDLELAHWDDELLAHSQANYEFRIRSFGLLNANLVPFNESWRDEHGGMANAIFDLPKFVPEGSTARLQGQWVEADGRLSAWNYCPMNNCLIYHILGKGTWEVTPEKIEVIDRRGSDAATIYRPFVKEQGEGTHQVQWLKTRELVVVSNHYLDQVPLYIVQAHKNVEHLLKRPFGQFPMARFHNLLFPIATRKNQPVDAGIAKAYRALVDQLQILTSKDLNTYKSFHIHSYTTMYRMTHDFNVAVAQALGGDLEEFKRVLAAQNVSILQQEIIDSREHMGMSYLYYVLYRQVGDELRGPLAADYLIPGIPAEHAKLFVEHAGYYTQARNVNAH